MTTPHRIGLLGASRIAPPAIIAPAADNPDFAIVAVAARDPDRAKAFAARHGIAHAAKDYEALVRRDDIDLVYNALPPAAHAPWTIAALEAGKHVLCEKPFACDAGEARAMVAAAEANSRHLLEAFHYRFHNVIRAAIALVREGALGELRRAEAVFEVPIARTLGELRWSAEQHGGALMDLGCYCAHALRTLAGTEPQVIGAAGVFEAGVDAEMRAELAFPGGLEASLACSMTVQAPKAALTVSGARGALEIVNFVAPQLGCRFTTTIDGESRSHRTEGPTTYAAQLIHVGEVLAGRAQPLTGGADAINTMALIDAIYEAARRP